MLRKEILKTHNVFCCVYVPAELHILYIGYCAGPIHTNGPSARGGGCHLGGHFGILSRIDYRIEENWKEVFQAVRLPMRAHLSPYAIEPAHFLFRSNVQENYNYSENCTYSLKTSWFTWIEYNFFFLQIKCSLLHCILLIQENPFMDLLISGKIWSLFGEFLCLEVPLYGGFSIANFWLKLNEDYRKNQTKIWKFHLY